MLYLYKKEKTTTSIKSLKQTQSKAAQKCHRYSVSWVCPNLLPVGHGWNPIKITSAWSTSGGICNTAGPICLSISRSTLPSLVNETPSYLNFLLSGNSTLSWLRTMSSGAPQENYIMELEKKKQIDWQSHKNGNNWKQNNNNNICEIWQNTPLGVYMDPSQ